MQKVYRIHIMLHVDFSQQLFSDQVSVTLLINHKKFITYIINKAPSKTIKTSISKMSNRQKLETSYGQIDHLQQSKNPSESLGVDGKFQWPIRIFTPILFGCTLLVNYLLGTDKNKEVSDKFSLWVTPPGFFFAIWAVIYSGLIIANIYNLIKNIWSLRTHIVFGISNLFNIVWTLVFDIGSLASTVIASFVLIALTASIFFTWLEMGKVPEKNITIITYIMRNIWAFYLGWCIAASNLNFGMDIVYWWGASQQTQMVIFWVMTPLCAIGAFTFNYVKYGNYGVLSCFCLWFSVAWAFAGAAITSNKCINGNC